MTRSAHGSRRGRSPQQATIPAPPLGTAPVASPSARLLALLELESAAAVRADTTTLLQLQTDKAQLLELLLAEPPSGLESAQLAERAQKNLPMLRQLVTLHRGMLGVEAPLYGPRGLRNSLAPGPKLAESR